MKGNSFQIIVSAYVWGGYFLKDAFKRHRQLRKVQDLALSKSASAPQGLVELEGFAWKNSTSMNDVSGKEAVYYNLQIQKEQKKGSGYKKNKTWVTVYTKSFVDSFYLADPKGLILIMPQEATFNFDNIKPQNWSSLSKENQNRIASLLSDEKIDGFPPSTGLLGGFSSKFRILEHKILLGSPLYLSGPLQSAGDGLSRKVKLHGLTNFYKKVFYPERAALKNVTAILDKNKDGKVSEEEALEGYTAAAQISTKTTKEGFAESEFEVYGTIAKSPQHELFISNCHEKHTVLRLKKGLTLRFLGGALALTFAVSSTLFKVAPNQFKKNATHVVTQSSSAPSPEDDMLAISETWHNECLANNFLSCRKLLTNRDQLHLAPENVTYYSYVACKNGLQDYCSKK